MLIYPRFGMALLHQHVFKLPRIIAINVFRKQLSTSLNGSPVGVLSDYWTEIRPLELKTASEVHLIGLDDAQVRVLQHPEDAGEDRGGDLQSGGILIGREPTSLLDRELRTVPVSILGVTVERGAKFIDTVADVVLAQDVQGLR